MGLPLWFPFKGQVLWVWHWLRADNASRVSVLLMVITGIYAWLTWRMARSIAVQTRSQAQPVLKPEFKIEEDESHPKGSFYMKNIGTQPLLILDILLTCRRDDGKEQKTYEMWNENLLPPGESYGFDFDFTEQLQRRGYTWWTPGMCVFSLGVVTSDLAKQTIITYKTYSTMSYVGVEHGMPWRLRWKNTKIFFRSRFYRVYYKIKRPKYFTPREKNVRGARKKAWLRRISNRLGVRARAVRGKK